MLGSQIFRSFFLSFVASACNNRREEFSIAQWTSDCKDCPCLLVRCICVCAPVQETVYFPDEVLAHQLADLLNEDDLAKLNGDGN